MIRTLIFLVCIATTGLDYALAQSCNGKYAVEAKSNRTTRSLSFQKSDGSTGSNLLAEELTRDTPSYFVTVKGLGRTRFVAVLAPNVTIVGEEVELCTFDKITIFDNQFGRPQMVVK
jgi:hypothetical protein